jgi:hypothetical protein
MKSVETVAARLEERWIGNWEPKNIYSVYSFINATVTKG